MVVRFEEKIVKEEEKEKSRKNMKNWSKAIPWKIIIRLPVYGT